jgi:hypothetical protein
MNSEQQVHEIRRYRPFTGVTVQGPPPVSRRNPGTCVLTGQELCRQPQANDADSAPIRDSSGLMPSPGPVGRSKYPPSTLMPFSGS